MAGHTDNVFAVRRRAYAVSELADPGRNILGEADYISCPDQKRRPAAGIAAYGINRAGFTIGIKVIFLLNISR